MSEEERAIDRLLVQELVQRRDRKTPEKFHFIKTGTIHSAAITYESWLQSVYCYMYIKSAAELKMSPQRSSRTNLRRSPRAPPAKSAADFAVKVRSGLCTPRQISILVDLWNWVHQNWTSKVHLTKMELRRTHVESAVDLVDPPRASVLPRWGPRWNPTWSNWSHVSPPRTHVKSRRTRVHRLKRLID